MHGQRQVPQYHMTESLTGWRQSFVRLKLRRNQIGAFRTAGGLEVLDV